MGESNGVFNGWTVCGDNRYLPFSVYRNGENEVVVKIIGTGLETRINVNTDEDADEIIRSLGEGLHHTISPEKAAELIAKETDFQPNRSLTIQLIHFLSSGPTGLVYVPRRFKSGQWRYVPHYREVRDGIIVEAGASDVGVSAFQLAAKLIDDFMYRYLRGDFDDY